MPTHNRLHKIELLAPARDADTGIEAIKHGADAVYIGGPNFGARSAAGNSVDDIARLCNFAHLYGARIYVTLNTILWDSELKAAEELVWQLYHAGVDALIVQDTALLQMQLPPIALHASTQMDNCTPEKAQWLEAAGYKQIVLARFNRPSILKERTPASIMASRSAVRFMSLSDSKCLSCTSTLPRSSTRSKAKRQNCAQHPLLADLSKQYCEA